MPRHRSCIPTAFMNWLLICLTHNGKAQFSKKQIWWDLVILYLIRIKATMVSQVLISWGFLFTSFVHEIEISICCSVQWFITRFTKTKAYISMYSVPCTIPTTTTTTNPPPLSPPPPLLLPNTDTDRFHPFSSLSIVISNPSQLPLGRIGQTFLHCPPTSASELLTACSAWACAVN